MRSHFVALCVGLLLGAPAAPARAQTTPAPRLGPLAALAPAPDQPGPHPVGRTTLSLDDASRPGRTLAVDVWYPVHPADAHGPPSRYELPLLGGIEAPLALGALPVSHERRWPLVLFSHGNFGIRFQSYFLCEALASHGFVVVAPDHTGNTILDQFAGVQPTPAYFAQTAIDRVRDVSFLIDAFVARSTTPGDRFEGTLDSTRIGVTGHSFGGFTALGSVTGVGSSVPADPRVRAIAPLAPASGFFTDADLARIRVPMMIVGGTADTTTPLDPQSTRPWLNVGSRSAAHAWIRAAGHFSFTNICELAEILARLGIPASSVPGYGEGCVSSLIPIGEAQRLIDLYVVSFFQVTLRHDLRYLPWLGGAFAARYAPAVDFGARAGSVWVR